MKGNRNADKPRRDRTSQCTSASRPAEPSPSPLGDINSIDHASITGAATQPFEQAIERPAVDHALARHAGQARVGDRGFGVGPLVHAVGVAVEREQAAGLDGLPRQLVVEILPRRIAIDLDGHAARRGLCEHRAQSAVMPGRVPYMRPRGWPRMWTPRECAAPLRRSARSDRRRHEAANAAPPARRRIGAAPPARRPVARRRRCSLRRPSAAGSPPVTCGRSASISAICLANRSGDKPLAIGRPPEWSVTAANA